MKLYDRATRQAVLSPVVIVPPVDPERIITTASCAMTGRRQVRVAVKVPAESGSVTGAGQHVRNHLAKTA